MIFDRTPTLNSAWMTVAALLVMLPLPVDGDEFPSASMGATFAAVEAGDPVGDIERTEKFQLSDQPTTSMFQPFELTAYLIVDASQSLRGGLTTNRGAIRHLFEVALSAPTEPLFGWSGGRLNATFQNQAGPDASILIGDLQVFSNIDADGRTQVSELWYEQVWADTPWRVRIGKVDANTQFAYVENGLAFLQSSMGFSPTVFALPTYPDPAFSANVFYEPEEGFYAAAGIYDGSLAQGVPTGSRGFGRIFRGADAFVIAEAGWRWDAGLPLADDSAALPGRFAAGSWYHNGRFDRFDGSTQSGTGGIYFLVDQLVFRESSAPEDGQGLGIFAQYGYADAEVSIFEHHFGTGLTWTGAIPDRDLDAVGLGLSLVELSQEPGAGFTERFELSTELFYSMQAAEYVSVVFDLQHIANPGGRRDVRDALVGTVRLLLEF